MRFCLHCQNSITLKPIHLTLIPLLQSARPATTRRAADAGRRCRRRHAGRRCTVARRAPGQPLPAEAAEADAARRRRRRARSRLAAASAPGRCAPARPAPPAPRLVHGPRRGRHSTGRRRRREAHGAGRRAGPRCACSRRRQVAPRPAPAAFWRAAPPAYDSDDTHNHTQVREGGSAHANSLSVRKLFVLF